MGLRIGRGELPAGGVAAIAFAVFVYPLDLNLWLAMALAVATYVGVMLVWPPVADQWVRSTGIAREHLAYEEALTTAAALRERTTRIARPDVQDRTVRMLDHADRILVAMNEDGNLAAAPVLNEGWLVRLDVRVAEYVRLSGRDVKSARARAERFKTCDLPRFEAAIDAFDEELNRDGEIDVAALRDVLDSYLLGLHALGPTEDAPALPAPAEPELSDPSAATRSFSPGATAARNAARFSLTPREHEIVILLAQSHPMMTDKELATELSIAFRTVGNHVANSLAKLGLNSRREIPAFATKHGLLPPSAPSPSPE